MECLSLSAKDRVLNSVELLEAILLHVDLKSLITASIRVCHFWQDLINVSVKIQEALFFQPISSTTTSSDETVSWCDRISERPTLNPLLIEKFSPVFFDFFAGKETNVYRPADCLHALPWTSNSMHELEHDSCINFSYRTEYLIKKRPSNHFIENANKMDRDRFTRQGASWRRMLVSQPPPPYIAIITSDMTPRFDRPLDAPFLCHQRFANGICAEPRADTNAPTGTEVVTMAHLYDLVQYHLTHHPFKMCWSRIHWLTPDGPFHHDNPNLSWCQDLLRETGLVVELAEFDNGYMAANPYAPADIARFGLDFKSQEFVRREMNMGETMIKGTNSPHYNLPSVMCVGGRWHQSWPVHSNRYHAAKPLRRLKGELRYQF